MADGRQHIEDTNTIIQQVAGEVAGLKDTYSAGDLAEFELYLDSAQKWVQLCRRKVWLRGQEGTELAQGCLDVATRLQADLSDPVAGVDAMADLSARLESLARLLATKSQVLT